MIRFLAAVRDSLHREETSWHDFSLGHIRKFLAMPNLWKEVVERPFPAMFVFILFEQVSSKFASLHVAESVERFNC